MRGLLTSAFFISVIIIGYAAEKEKVQLKRLFEPDNQPLIVTTRTLTSQSATLVQEFAQNAIIGLHATSGTPGNLYNGKSEYNNIKLKATSLKHRRINWQQTPKVMLTSKAATIYAYAPYQALYPFNPNRIPIKIAADANYTPDYMYGRQAVGQKAVSQISPYAQLQMKYALVRVTFEVCGEGINDSSYSISSIQISNRAGGNLLHSAGTMNIATGQITPDIDTTIPTLLTLVHPMALGTKRVKTENGSLSSDTPLHINILPPDKPFSNGDVEVRFRINGSLYLYTFPSTIFWKKGTIYHYAFSFNGQALKLLNSQTAPWIPGK